MKVIICGAGRVGYSIARHLAMEGMHVTVVDNSPEQARRADETDDIRGIIGHASHPEVLERAGAHDADMLIAVTRVDEVNMVACQVAYSLFKIPRRVARLRHPGYLAPIWKGLYANDQLPIDVIITPEIEVANGILRRLKTPGAFDSFAMADGRVQLLGISCSSQTCNVVGKRMSDLADFLPHVVPIAIIRAGTPFLPSPEDRIQENDSLYVITLPEKADQVMSVFGHEEKVAHRVVIVGAGNVGLNLATQLIKSTPALSLKVIENTRSRAELVSQELGDGAVVLHGDALDREILDEANVDASETVVAVTDDDETNIFACVLAKREGCTRAITLVNKSVYETILPGLGIDAVVSPNNITISSILRHVRPRSVSTIYTLREDFGEVVEAVVQPGTLLTEDMLHNLKLPEGMKVGAVVRDDEVIIPTSDMRIESGDRIVAIVTYKALHAAEAVLGGPSGTARHAERSES